MRERGREAAAAAHKIQERDKITKSVHVESLQMLDKVKESDKRLSGVAVRLDSELEMLRRT